MAGSIAILEDDERRRAEMRRILVDAALGEPLFAVTAYDFIQLMRLRPDGLGLISLDHDLEPPTPHHAEDGCANRHLTVDPGTGRDVAEFLATREPICPIIIHSTNYAAALAMEAILSEGDWRVDRVMPYGDLTWIAEIWSPLVAGLLDAPRAA